MSNIIATRTVTVTGLSSLGEGFETATLLGISHPYGEQFGEVSLLFPRLFAGQADGDASPKGLPLKVVYNGGTIFRGYVTQCGSMSRSNADGVLCQALDYRWLLHGRRIGMYGVGNADETAGGFAVVGYRVRFNPEGLGNRSTSGTDGLYEFSRTDGARWTGAQVLQWLVHWYGLDMTLDSSDLEALPSIWSDPVDDLYLYGLSLPQALSKLCGRMGASWSIRYEGDAILWTLIAAARDGMPETTVVYNSSDAPGEAADATDLCATDVDVTERITDSVGRVEVHSGLVRVEMCLTTVTGDANAVKALEYDTITCTPVDIAGYACTPSALTDLAATLGLPTGARPVRWLRELVTRIPASSSTYVSAQSAGVTSPATIPMRTEQAIWVRPKGENGPARLVASGVRIDFDGMRLQFGRSVRTIDGLDFSQEGEYSFADFFDVWITVTVEYSCHAIRRSNVVTVADQLMADVVLRSDIIPQRRYRSILPDLSASDPNDQITNAAAAEEYNDWATPMETLAATLGALRHPEIVVNVQLLDIPTLRPGNRLLLAPDNGGIGTGCVITHYELSLEPGARAVLHATNGLDRLLTGDFRS